MRRGVKPRDVRRAEVLDQALALFLERGYANVSLNDLLAAVGVPKGSGIPRADDSDRPHIFGEIVTPLSRVGEGSSEQVLAGLTR